MFRRTRKTTASGAPLATKARDGNHQPASLDSRPPAVHIAPDACLPAPRRSSLIPLGLAHARSASLRRSSPLRSRYLQTRTLARAHSIPPPLLPPSAKPIRRIVPFALLSSAYLPPTQTKATSASPTHSFIRSNPSKPPFYRTFPTIPFARSATASTTARSSARPTPQRSVHTKLNHCELRSPPPANAAPGKFITTSNRKTMSFPQLFHPVNHLAQHTAIRQSP